MTKNTSLLITKGSGLIILLLGVFFMSSLLLHLESLIQLAPSYTPLKYNTVLCFLCIGLGLISLSLNQKKLTLVLGMGVCILALLTLLQYALNVDFGVDQFFFTSYLNHENLKPGRMAPLTAWGLFFASIVLMVSPFCTNRWHNYSMRFLAALILITGVVPLIGYMTGVEKAYTFGRFSAMSLQAVILFIITSIGFNVYSWQGGALKNKRTFAIWVSLLVTSIVLFFSIAVWRENLHRENQILHERLRDETKLIQHRILDQMNYSIMVLHRMAQRWEMRAGTPENEWRDDVKNYIVDANILKVIAWIDNTYQFQWLEPQIQNQNSLNQHIYFDNKNKELIEKRQAKIMLSAPFNLSGYKALLVYIPLYVNQQFQGFIAGIYDIDKLVTHSISLAAGNSLYVTLKEGDTLLYSSLDNLNEPQDSYEVVFPLFNQNWTLTVIPKKDFLALNSSYLPYLELIVGLLLSLLLGTTLYHALTAAHRNKLLIEQSEALARSERRQQQLIEDVHDYAIFWLDLKGNIETWNSGAEHIFGYKSKEIINRSFIVFFTQDAINSSFPQKILNIATTTGKFEGDAEYVGKNKQTFWANVTVEPLKATHGELLGFVMIVQDITQRRLLEIERSKLIAIIEESPDFIGMADLNGNLLYHNRSAKRMVGLKDDADLSLMKIANMHPLWAFNIIHNQVLPHVEKEGHWTGETALLHQYTGKEIPVLQTLSLHRDPLGNPICFTTIMRDISERKKTEEVLKNNETIFRYSMEHAAIGMALVSPEGKWLKVNKALRLMIGYTEEELLKIDFQTITHRDDLEKDLGYVQQMLDNKIQKYAIEKRYIHKDGHIIWILLNVSLARNADGSPNYFISQIQNITDRKYAEAAQEKLITQLANSNMELERFAYVASHDMQEPLRMIVCFSDILIKEFAQQLTSEAKEYLNIVCDSGKRMQDIIQDLLEYSRIYNEVKLFRVVDGTVALEHVLENLKIFINESNALVTYDKLPNFIGNSIQFVRLLQNLIVNGIKYQPKNAIPTLHIGVQDRNSDWCFFVQDNGLGIPLKFAAQVFQPFRRLHSWDTIKGTGLGLSICKKIVELHGGTIWVDPNPGGGSIFYFTLPKIDVTDSHE